MHILASPGYAPGKIAVNVTWMERGFNACQTHIPIYLQPFTSYSEILVGIYIDSEIATFSYIFAFNAPIVGDPLGRFRDFWWVSCRMARLQYVAKISPKS